MPDYDEPTDDDEVEDTGGSPPMPPTPPWNFL